MHRILFVTGTDTGVGKTVVTSLLVRFLRDRGTNAIAMKPFCTGQREDVQCLQAAQGARFPDSWINPFFFSLPVAPAVAAQRAGRRISIAQVLRSIQRLADRCEFLLVEGAGGLLAPLGAGPYTAEDLIASLRCEVLVVAKNKLGTLNHTALVMRILDQQRRATRVQVVLNQTALADASTRSNAAFLRRWLKPALVSEIPFCPRLSKVLVGSVAPEKKLKKVLATILR